MFNRMKPVGCWRFRFSGSHNDLVLTGGRELQAAASVSDTVKLLCPSVADAGNGDRERLFQPIFLMPPGLNIRMRPFSMRQFLSSCCLLLPALAWGKTGDFGGFMYQLYQSFQTPPSLRAPPRHTAPVTPAFTCERGVDQQLACMDDQKRRYRCKSYGASGDYCERMDALAWIHCHRIPFHTFRRDRYKCSIISSKEPSPQPAGEDMGERYGDAPERKR